MEATHTQMQLHKAHVFVVCHTHTHTHRDECLVSPSIFINLRFVNLRLADRTDRKQTVKLYIWCI